MKKLLIIIIASLAIITSAFTVSILWNIANEGVTVNFELPEEGTKGTLSGLKAMINFDQKNLVNSGMEVTMDVKTLNTGNQQKDHHLLSADFFNAEKYPLITFVSSSIKTTEMGFLATGDLTIKDSTKTIEIPFTFTEEKNTGVFKGSLAIYSGDFGIMKKSNTGKDKVLVTITVPVNK